MNPLIGVSTQCLYYWADQSKWMSEQLRLIDILYTHVSRLELHFGARDILALDASLLEQYAQSLRGLTCSLHLPNFPDTRENIQPLINKIAEIVERLSIEYCVLHADEYVKLKLKMPDVVLGFQFGLENSDIRKFGFQHLRDLGMFNLPVIVDIDHVEEMERGSLDAEMAALHNPVLGIHFSTPRSTYFASFPNIKTTHFPFARSGSPLPKHLPPDVPIVIEGIIPPSGEELLEEEISLIKETYFALSKKK